MLQINVGMYNSNFVQIVEKFIETLRTYYFGLSLQSYLVYSFGGRPIVRLCSVCSRRNVCFTCLHSYSLMSQPVQSKIMAMNLYLNKYLLLCKCVFVALGDQSASGWCYCVS